MNYNLKCDEAATRRIVEAVKPATLVAATKYTTADEMAKLEANGVTIFGENRVQDFLKKKEVYQGKAHWHFPLKTRFGQRESPFLVDIKR